jgi:hypothetical protein
MTEKQILNQTEMIGVPTVYLVELCTVIWIIVIFQNSVKMNKEKKLCIFRICTCTIMEYCLAILQNSLKEKKRLKIIIKMYYVSQANLDILFEQNQ